MHTERLRGAALAGPLVGLGIAIAAGALIAFATQSAVAWVVVLAPLLAMAWIIASAKIEVTVDPQHVYVRAPLFTRKLMRSGITSVAVASDDGMNEGSVSWFVTRQDEGTRTRVNLGGNATVTLTDAGGHRIQVVVKDLDTANRIAAAVQD